MASHVSSQDYDCFWFNFNDGSPDTVTSLALPLTLFDSIIPQQTIKVVATNGERLDFERSKLINCQPGYLESQVAITFRDDDLHIISNPYAFEGVEVERDGSKVIITSTSEEEITYCLRGTSTDGAVKIYSDSPFTLVLDNLTLTSTESAAINIQSKKKATVSLIGSSSLTDSSVYDTPEDEDEKGTFFSEGKLVFTGDGSLTIKGNKKHALASDKTVEITSGEITINGVVADANGVQTNDGMTMSGGVLRLLIDTDQSKGIKTKATMTMTGGEIYGTLSGNAVVVDNDPSYCTLIKAQDFEMSGGYIQATHSGKAGKGISVDGDATWTGGTVDITTTGSGDVYQDANGDYDSYSATCITVDGNLTMTAGTFTLKSTGSAGKCIKVDTDATFGDNTTGPTITASTTGGQLQVSNSSWGGGGWFAPGGGGGGNWPGWGPGGGGSDTDYANPKVIKGVGNLTVNNGDFTLSASQDGGEGLESKSTLTINGGEIRIKTYDDAINAASAIVINGGKIYAYATGNDAIDSNGTMTINGGLIIAVGTTSPEGGIDCDNNTFKITGGTMVAIGGANSSVTSSVTTQRVVAYSTSVTKGTPLTITDSNQQPILSFTSPQSFNGSAAMLITSPSFQASASYSIYSGGTLSGADEWECISLGGAYTPGSLKKTFTISQMVTTVR